MSERQDCTRELLYIVRTISVDHILRPRVQRNLNKRVYNHFLNLLKEHDVQYYAHKKFVKTSLGFFKFASPENGVQEIRIFSDMDIPYGNWQAGQLARMALCATEKFYHSRMCGLMTPQKIPVSDLSVIEITAELDGNKIERTIGALPLKYLNGKPIARSLSIIKDFKAEICAELSLQQQVKPGTEVNYEIRRAYAWHFVHGSQPGFSEEETLQGLEAKVIDHGRVPLHSASGKN